LIAMGMDPSKYPSKATIRDFPDDPVPGEAKYGYDWYLAQRGDANVKTFADMLGKAKYFNDGTPGSGKPTRLKESDGAMIYDTTVRMQRRFAVQQIVLMCLVEQKLDAVVYPTGTLPPAKIWPPAPRGGPGPGGRKPTGPSEGQTTWTFLGAQGFPAITVPGGFTTEAYNRVPDVSPAPAETGAASTGGPGRPRTHLVGPVPAVVPIGFDFLGRPFSEPGLIQIAAAYEAATRHRRPPADFGPVTN
jgi:amidase